MKFLIMLTLLLGSVFCFADEDMEKAQKNFEKRKAKRIERIDNQIKEMTKLKTCIQKSKSHDELKVCQKALHEKHKKMKKMRKEKKSERQERRAKRKGKKETSDDE